MFHAYVYLHVHTHTHTHTQSCSHRDEENVSVRRKPKKKQHSCTHEKEIVDLKQQLWVKDGQFTALRRELEESAATGETQERATRRADCLAELNEHLYQKLSAREEELEYLRRKLQGGGGDDLPHSVKVSSGDKSSSSLSSASLNLTWHQLADAPFKFSRGCATTCLSSDECAVYLVSQRCNQIYKFDLVKIQWSPLPPCPYTDFGLVDLGGLVTTVGGYEPSGQLSCELRSLRKGKRVWSPIYPAMLTLRACLAVACSGDTLVVAGGVIHQSFPTDCVEVLNTTTCEWARATPLPSLFSSPWAAVVGKDLYVGGSTSGVGSHLERASVIRCSMESLRHSAVTSAALQAKAKKKEPLPAESSNDVWHRMPCLPNIRSAVVALGDHLLAIGGGDVRSTSSAVYVLRCDPMGVWLQVGNMSVPRSSPVAAVVPGGRMVVVVGGLVSGKMADSEGSNVVEYANVE